MLIHGIAITAKALLITHIVFRTQIDNFAPLTFSQHGAHHVEGGLTIIKPHFHIHFGALHIHQFNNRDFGGTQELNGTNGMVLFGKNNAIDIVGEQIDHRLLFGLFVVIIVSDKCLIIMVRCHRLNARENVSKQLILERGDQHTQRIALRIEQHAGRTIGYVVDLFHDHRDALAGGPGYGFRRADIPADGHFGDPRQRGDILK